MKATNNFESLSECFPIIEVYKSYFEKVKKSNKFTNALKQEASKKLIGLDFFNMKLTLDQVGTILGTDRFFIIRCNKDKYSIEGFDSVKILKKCVKHNLYPQPNKEGKKPFNLFPYDEETI
jgi:hypothetical protein